MSRHTKPELPMTKVEYKALMRSFVPEKTRAVLVEAFYPSDDHEYGYSPGSKRQTNIGRNRIVRDAVAYYLHNGYTRANETPLFTEGERKGQKDYASATLRPPSSLKEVLSDVAEQNGGDHEGGTTYVLTMKQAREAEEKELRGKAESIAAMICSKYKVQGGTLKFINACYKHYGRIVESERNFRDDPERRMERMADCMFSGAGSATFFEDNDYSSSQISEANESLDTVMEYLGRFSPLLVTRYREIVAKRKAKES